MAKRAHDMMVDIIDANSTIPTLSRSIYGRKVSIEDTGTIPEIDKVALIRLTRMQNTNDLFFLALSPSLSLPPHRVHAFLFWSPFRPT
jgi:hypothetical protein